MFDTIMVCRRRCYLPADLCAQAQVSQEQVYRGESSDALCDVVFQTATVANVRSRAVLAQCGGCNLAG